MSDEKHVLVTGATGFVGGALARELRRIGHQVEGLGRNLQKGRLLETEGISFTSAELTDRRAIVQACKGKDGE